MKKVTKRSTQNKPEREKYFLCPHGVTHVRHARTPDKPLPFFLIFIFFFLSSLQIMAQASFKNGPYQFRIERDDGHEIVFNALVKDSLNKQIMYIINGSDYMLIDSIELRKDSVFLQLPFFQSGFAARIKKDHHLEGVWIKKDGDKIRNLPFTAIFDKSERFKQTASPKYNISGTWAATIIDHEGKESDAIGRFFQDQSRLTGTFLTPYGDYRFLEGVVTGDSLFLSGFDGSYALFFSAKIDEEYKISGGRLYSGNAPVRTWEAIKDDNAKLENPENITKLKPGASKLDFSFPDMDGNIVSISDERFKNKVVVIQIMGSWCPNCLDESKFIMENYERYTRAGVAFLGLAYERTDDFETSVRALRPFQKKFRINYPVLIPPVAVSDTLRTEKTLPQIDKIVAFPTTIFLDKSGNVRKIHAGFDGPATGDHYIRYQKQFNDTIMLLLKE